MSLPDAAAVGTLAFVSEGLPFVTARPGIADTGTLSFVFSGLPFFAQSGGGVAGSGGTRPVVFVCT